MKVPTPSPDGPREDAELAALDFEFEDDAWFERLQSALRPRILGRIGPYEVLGDAHRGGQGAVFRARQPGTQRVIALKRLLEGAFASRAARARFEREVEAAASLDHPGIVTVFGMDEVDGQPLLAMEWVEGEPITEWCGRGAARRSPEQILELFLRVADAVQHAHLRGVLHRDLKPSNILVDARGRPHVLDFGLAKRLDVEEAESDRMTASSHALGTPAHSAPEQMRLIQRPIDVRSDVYALGVLLYEMLTGRSPWGEWENTAQLLRRIEHGDPPRPSSIDPRLPSGVDGVVLQAMALEPASRYASVEAFAMDVRRMLSGQPVHALPPGRWELLVRAARRNRSAAALAAGLFLALGAFAAHARWQANRLSAALELVTAEKEQAQLESQRAAALLRFVPDCVPQSASLPWARLPWKDSTSEGTLGAALMSTPSPVKRYVGPEDVEQ